MADKRTIGVKAEVDVSAYNQGLRSYLSGLNQMVSATTSSVARMNSSASAITTGIAAAVGVTAVQAIQTFVRALAGIGQAAIEQVGFFERLAISLNFYAARAIQSSRDGLGLADAMVEARDAAEDLMLWLQQLALASPFTTRQVSDAFRTAQAYGLSLEAARKLVPLLIDFAAINNLSDDILGRIALALGQIQARGKLAAQEINQLANAGVPVRDLLAKGLGVTRGEFEKLLEDGLIPAAPALKIITEYLQQFEGMANRVTRETLTGMISQFKDLQEIATRDLFGGIAKTSIPVLNELSDFLNQPNTFAALKEVGNILGNQVKNGVTTARNAIVGLMITLTNLSPEVKQAIFVFITFGALIAGTAAIVGAFAVVVGLLLNQFTVLVVAGAVFAAAWVSNFNGIRTTLQAFETRIGETFTSVASVISRFTTFATTNIGKATDALTSYAGSLSDWGGNIVSSLADGIMGGVGIITQALTALGDIFTYWLQPGSPPRLLPDLEKWGKETANVWLQSWRSADFGILQDISSDISGILKGLVSAGALGEEKPPRILIELRPLIAQAVDEFRRLGAVSQDSLKRMRDAAGPAGNAILPLLQRYISLSAATDAVKAAQEKLTAITERYNRALQPIRDKLAEISKLRETNDENREILALQRTIANVGVSAGIKRSAQLRIQEILIGRQIKTTEDQQTAEEKVADAELQAAQKRESAAEEALNQMKAQIDIQNTQLELYGEEAKILEQIRKEQERLAKEALKKQLEALQHQLEVVKLLQEELKDTVGLFKAQYTLGDATATAAEKAAAALEIQRIAASRIVRDFEAIQLGIDPATLEKIRQTVVTLEDIGIKGDGLSDFEDALDGAAASIDDLSEKAKKARKDVQDYFEKLATQWDNFLRQIDQSLPPFLRFRNEVSSSNKSLSDNVRSVSAANEAFGKGAPILRTFATLIGGIAAAFASSRLISIIVAIPLRLAQLATGFNPLILAISLFAGAWAGDWFNIRQVTADAISYIQGKLNEFWQSPTWANITSRFELIQETVENTVKRVLAYFKLLFFQVRSIIQSGFNPIIISNILEFWSGLFERFVGNILTLFTGTLPTSVAYFFTSLFGLITKYWNPFTAILLASMDDVIAVFGSLLKPLTDAFQAGLPTLVSVLKGLPRQILTSVGSLMGTTGRTLIQLLSSGFTGGGNLLINVLAKSISTGVSAIISVLSGGPLRAAQATFANGFQTAFTIVTKAFQIFQSVLSAFKGTGFFATFAANIKSVSNSLGITAGLGGPFAKAFVPVIAIFRTIGNYVELVYHSIQTLVTTNFNTLRGGVQSVIDLFGNLIKSAGSVRQFVVSVITVIDRLGTDLYGLISGVVTAFRSLSAGSFMATFIANMQHFLNIITVNKIPLFEALRPMMALFKTLREMATGFFNVFVRASTIRTSFIADIFTSVVTNIKTAVTYARQFFTVFTNLPALLTNSLRALGVFFTNFKSFGASLNISKNLTGALGGMSKSIVGFLQNFSGFQGQLKITSSLQSFFTSFTGFISGIGKGIGGGFSGIRSLFNLITSFNPGKFISGFKAVFNVFKGVGKAFGGFLNPLNLLISAIDFFAFAFNNNIDGVENGAKGLVANLQQFWADLISGKLWTDITEGFNKGIQWVKTVWTEFQKNGLSSPLLQKMFIDLGMSIVENLKTIGNTIWVSLTTFWLPVFGQWVMTSIVELGVQLSSLLIFIRDWIVIAGTWISTQITTVWIPAFTGWWNSGAGEALTTNLMFIVTTIWDWIKTSAAFIYTELIASWVPTFVQWVSDAVPPLLGFLGGLLLTLLGWIVAAVPPLIQTILEWATAFVQWLGPVVKWTLENLGVWMGALVEWIVGVGLPWLIGAVVYLAGALIGWVNDPGPGGATTQIPAALGNFLKALVDFIIFYVVPGLWNAGVSIATGLWNGLKTAWGTFMDTEAGQTLNKFLEPIATWLVNVYDAGSSIAKNLWDGLVWGINEYITEPIEAMAGAWDSFIAASKEKLGISSPSSVFKDDIAGNIVAGLIQGVEAIYNNPVFSAIHDAMVGGFEAVKEATVAQFVSLAEGSVQAVREILTAIDADIATFASVVLTKTSNFSDQYMILINALAGLLALAWLGIRNNTLTETTAIYTNTLTDFTNLNTQLGLKMPIIQETVVGGFTSMRTAVDLEIKGMVADILSALVGNGTVEDTTSLASLLKVAMSNAGRIIGEFFVAGIAEGIKSTASLTVLTEAIYFIVKKAFEEANKQMETGSPSKRAARELGLPWSQGVASGMLKGVASITSAAAVAANSVLSSRLASEFASRGGSSVPGYSNNSSSTRNYYLNVQSRQPSQGIINDFTIMRSVDI